MTVFGSDSVTASMRARWLLTLSAFGVACGQTPAGNDAMVNDVTSSDQSAIDATASDTGAATDSGVAADSGVVTDSGVSMDSGVGTDSGAPADARAPTDVGGDRPAVPDASVGPYPAGPYGNMEGQTLQNLALQGYLNTEGAALSNTLPYGPVSMQDLRRTGRRYALVHTSATY